MATEPARLAGIPVLLCWVDPGWKFSKESRLPGGPSNEPSEKQDGRLHTVHAHCFPGSCGQSRSFWESDLYFIAIFLLIYLFLFLKPCPAGREGSI